MKTCGQCKHFKECEPWKATEGDQFAKDCPRFTLKTNFEAISDSPKNMAKALYYADFGLAHTVWCHDCKFENPKKPDDCLDCVLEWLNKPMKAIEDV